MGEKKKNLNKKEKEKVYRGRIAGKAKTSWIR